MKEKILEKLGGIGIVVWYMLCLLSAVFPVVAIDAGGLWDMILLGTILFIPATGVIFWVWGLICMIKGPQDIIAIAYYVYFVALFIPGLIADIHNLYRKFSSK